MINRRNLLYTALTSAAVTAAAATGAAIPAVADQGGVSPRMLHLIAEFTRLNAALDVAETSPDRDAWDRAAEARRPALEDLVFERPRTLADLAAKMTALSEFADSEDTEYFTLSRLAEDARFLLSTEAR